MGIYVDKKVEECKCPEPNWCTIATTCYEPLEREHMCLKCWIQYCNENNIEILYPKFEKGVKKYE